ncbi:MAG: integrase [Myxococcaceae bacterium]|nr:integrase [Myxococcaceae bacterium]
MTLPDLAPTPDLHAPLDRPALLEAARGYVEAAKAPNTRRAYRTQWRTFAAWCERYGREPLPAAPATLALFLTARAQAGLKVASLGLALSAIRAAHGDAGLADPAATPEVRTVWEGIRRTHGAAPCCAAPLTADAVRALVAGLPPGLRGARDRALVLLGFGGALRRSELVALDVQDLTFDPARGVVVRVRRSKTDQTAEGADVAVPFGSRAEVCPVRAVEAWRDAAGLREGALLRSVDRHGRVGGRLDGRDVARTLKELAARAGLATGLVSGHSLRAGLATTAALAGRGDRAIMAQGRWKSRTMVDRYVRTADSWRDNAAAGLL